MSHTTDWFPGRVTKTYRDNYESIFSVKKLEEQSSPYPGAKKGLNKELMREVLSALTLAAATEVSGMVIEMHGGQKAFRTFCVNHNLNYSMVQEYDAYIVSRRVL